ncbi:polysaccharide biosynthesis tyrosine autokinase [Drancourtella massiliensis]|uniref:non-specific protein-tyrosine kinase n=1 Tax=Drancourtella massiliensis TaxID=1632013 RepID=A0ABS2EHH0_9FIRM|nr:polysaccharide biosynthesis tyrosine autokinase [Drancourtella massiliensis]MBM6744356.1 polysaccharide biosynthesis tyrosine autokinase [Drancourtella massiliensis]
MKNEVREFRLDEISILCIIRDLLKNIWVILLAAAAGWFAVTGVMSFLYVPEFTAQATMAVSARGGSNAYSSLSLTNQMAGVFSEVFDSNVLKEKIAEELGEDSINETIQATVIEETNLITLQVTSENPRRAYQVIQSAIRNYDEVSDYLFSNAMLRIVQEPSVPYAPSNAMNSSRYQKLAILAGAVGSGGLIVLLSILRFTVKTREGAKRNLDGRILELIPYERKNKTVRGALRKLNKSILISSKLVSMPFGEAVRKTATRIDHHMRRRDQKVLMVTSVAENEGKSSVAANLALALAEKGRRVMLIDVDLKKPALYKVFEKKEENRKYLSDYLDKKAEIKDVLIYEKKEKIYTVFQEKSIHNAARYLDSMEMKALIDAGRKKMDYIILDTPPMSVSSDAELMLKMADNAVLIVRQDWTDVRAANDASDTIRQAGVDFTGFILNAFLKEQLWSSLREHSYYGYGRTDGSEEV